MHIYLHNKLMYVHLCAITKVILYLCCNFGKCHELAHSNSGKNAWNVSASQPNDKAESSAMIAKEVLNKAQRPGGGETHQQKSWPAVLHRALSYL